jgi:hypothetical protein
LIVLLKQNAYQFCQKNQVQLNFLFSHLIFFSILREHHHYQSRMRVIITVNTLIKLC